MAAVQPSQNLQQQAGNANMLGGNGVMPPGMTKEQVQQVYKVGRTQHHIHMSIFIYSVANQRIEIPADEAERRTRERS